MNSLMAAMHRPVDFAENVGSGFRGRNAEIDAGDILTGLLILIGVVLGVWLLSRIPAVQSRVRRFNNPRALFNQLCRAHHLDRSSRRLLRRLARYHRIKQPAQLFLEPKLFSGRMTGRLRSERQRIHELRDRLFAQPASCSRPQPSGAEQPAEPKVEEAVGP